MRLPVCSTARASWFSIQQCNLVALHKSSVLQPQSCLASLADILVFEKQYVHQTVLFYTLAYVVSTDTGQRPLQ